MVDNYLKEHENYLNNDLQTSKATHLPTWDWQGIKWGIIEKDCRILSFYVC